MELGADLGVLDLLIYIVHVNGEELKLLNEIFQIYVEIALVEVVVCVVAEPIPQLWCPELGFVVPISLPLVFAESVPHFEELQLLSIDIYFRQLQNREA